MRNYQDSLFGAPRVLRGKILAVTPHAHWGALMRAAQRGLGWQTLGLWALVKSLGQRDNPVLGPATSERTHDSAEPEAPGRNGWERAGEERHMQTSESNILSSLDANAYAVSSTCVSNRLSHNESLSSNNLTFLRRGCPAQEKLGSVHQALERRHVSIYAVASLLSQINSVMGGKKKSFWTAHTFVMYWLALRISL